MAPLAQGTLSMGKFLCASYSARSSAGYYNGLPALAIGNVAWHAFRQHSIERLYLSGRDGVLDALPRIPNQGDSSSLYRSALRQIEDVAPNPDRSGTARLADLADASSSLSHRQRGARAKRITEQPPPLIVFFAIASQVLARTLCKFSIWFTGKTFSFCSTG